MSCRFMILSFGLLALLDGCKQGPTRVQAPTWDPDDCADQIISKLDASGDGALDANEFAAAPGLAWGAKYIDGDKDGLLTRVELLTRFELYERMRVGIMSKRLQLTYKGRPVAGAKVKLIPEFFLEQVIEPATGETFNDGSADFQAEGIQLSGLRPGYYRIVIDSPKVKIPAKYGAADSTTLGVELAPYTNDPAADGTIELRLTD